MEKLSSLTIQYVDEPISIGQMERGYLRQVVQLCLSLLKFVIQAKLAQSVLGRPCLEAGEKLKSSGKRIRKYLSLFGMIEFWRPAHCSDQRGMIYMLDEYLSMPRDLWSYNLQELTAQGASEENFRQSVKLLNDLLDLGLSGTASERNVDRLGSMVDQYYEAKAVIEVPAGACFSASFDGKGVPKIKARDKDSSKRFARLGKGQKRGIKQMATLGVMSWFEPQKRDKASIIRGLMGWYDQSALVENKSQRNDNRWHQQVHRRAFLADQDKAIDYGLGYIKARMKHPQSRFVVPIDAGIGLEDKVIKYVKLHHLEDRFDGIILDLIHVSEYVWDCANAVFGEKSNLRPQWVKEVLEDLLDSKTQTVIKDLQNIVDKSSLSEARKAKVAKAITYFTNHAHKMDYKTYLDKGYPISSALVESNCKHLVKDRMEQSGMRWSSQGAQAMMDVRAVKLNGDLQDFISFVEAKDRKCHSANAA